jgi:hypothetical protein
MGSPATGCRTLIKPDFIRVPFPAASITEASDSIAINSREQYEVKFVRTLYAIGDQSVKRLAQLRPGNLSLVFTYLPVWL